MQEILVNMDGEPVSFPTKQEAALFVHEMMEAANLEMMPPGLFYESRLTIVEGWTKDRAIITFHIDDKNEEALCCYMNLMEAIRPILVDKSVPETVN